MKQVIHKLCSSPVIGIAVIAFLLRFLALLILINADVSKIYTYEHGEIARNMLEGKGFSVRLLGTWGLTSQQAPVIPFTLAACYAVLGTESSAAHWLFLLVQAVQGALSAVGGMLLARNLFRDSKWPSYAVGLGVACSPPLIYAVTHIQVASTAILLNIWLFVGLIRVRSSLSLRDALWTGILLGLAALTDPILVLAGVAASISWILIDRPEIRTDLLRLAQCWCVLFLFSWLTISPWLVRCYAVHGKWVFVKSTFGYAFWQGNNHLSIGTDKVLRPSVREKLSQPSAGLAGTHEKLWEARHEAGCVDDIALSRQDKAELGILPELERSEELFRRARVELAGQPGRYLTLCLRRLRYFLWIDESNPKTANVLYQVCQKLLTVSALAGFLMIRREIRRKTAAIWLAFLMTTAFHALTITAPRFHLPWEPHLIFMSVAGLESLFSRRKSLSLFGNPFKPFSHSLESV